jgi:hypothetical protein
MKVFSFEIEEYFFKESTRKNIVSECGWHGLVVSTLGCHPGGPRFDYHPVLQCTDFLLPAC